MQVMGFIELSGIQRVVLDREEVWNRRTARRGKIYWACERTVTPRDGNTMGVPAQVITGYRGHAEQIRWIQRYIQDPGKRVWVHGDTVNVQTLEKPRRGTRGMLCLAVNLDIAYTRESGLITDDAKAKLIIHPPGAGEPR